MKFQSIGNREMRLKSSREEMGNKIKQNEATPLKNWEWARRWTCPQQHWEPVKHIFNLRKENYFYTWILYTVKVSIQWNGGLKFFLQYVRYQNFAPFLREVPEDVLHQNKAVNQERWRHEIQGTGAHAQDNDKRSPQWQLCCRPARPWDQMGQDGWLQEKNETDRLADRCGWV